MYQWNLNRKKERRRNLYPLKGKNVLNNLMTRIQAINRLV